MPGPEPLAKRHGTAMCNAWCSHQERGTSERQATNGHISNIAGGKYLQRVHRACVIVSGRAHSLELASAHSSPFKIDRVGGEKNACC